MKSVLEKYSFPPGWEIVRVEEIGEVRLGRQRSPKHHTGPNMRPYLRVANVYEDRIDTSDVLSMNFTPQEYEVYRLEPGDLLLNEGQSLELVGRPAMYRGEVPGACFQNTLVRFRPGKLVLPEFALIVFRAYLHLGIFQKIARWTTSIAHLGAKRFAELDFPLPPLDDQRRIVEAVDTHLTRLDAAVSGLGRVRANLKRYRASVLKAACEGRLVPTEAELARREGRDYEPADVLLSRILKERRERWEAEELAKLTGKGKTPTDDRWKRKYKEPQAPDTSGLPELPEGWVWVSLDTLLYGIEAGKNFRCEERPPEAGEVGVAKVSAVSWGEYDDGESKTVTDLGRVDPRYFIQPGDFLFSRANTIELVGTCVIAENLNGTIMLSDKILRFRMVSAFSQIWILHCLRSLWGRYEIERLSTGNQLSMRNIGQDRIRKIRIPLPPPSELARILDGLEQQLSVSAAMHTTVETGLARASRLRQSVLKCAFEDCLVAQDSALSTKRARPSIGVDVHQGTGASPQVGKPQRYR